MSDFLQVSTTAPSEESAARLASSAVGARLVAGAQVFGPVASFFWHLGVQGEGEEWQVTMKTTSARLVELQAHLVATHEWGSPKITAVELVGVWQTYGDRIRRTTSGE